MTQQPAPPPQRNLLVFFLLVTALLFGYMQFRNILFPAPAPIAEGPQTPDAPARGGDHGGRVDPTLLARPPITPTSDLLDLNKDDDGDFFLNVQLDPLGAGVRAVSLNRFRAATSSGRPADGILDLIPANANVHEPSFLLCHFSQKTLSGERPEDTLARRKWTAVKTDGKAVVTDEYGGKQRKSVTFTTEIDGVKISKTYSLTAGDYHLGLAVTLERPKAGPNAKDVDKQSMDFRYQLSGAKGLPVEGKWYTSIFRNALIGLEDDRGNVYRDFQDLRHISTALGGNPIDSHDDRFIRYAGVVVQYFASVIAVDSDPENGQKDWKFLSRATPTLETGVLRGRVKAGTLGQSDRIVLISDDGKYEMTGFMPPSSRQTSLLYLQRDELREGMPVALIYHHASFDEKLKESPRVIDEIRVGRAAEATHSVWVDDITVRVTTNKVALKPGSKVTHRYVLYNGPVKPSLLGQLRGDKAVDAGVVAHYVDTLKLNTLTDYQSPGFMGTISGAIGWSYVVITSTNVMHWVLGKMHLIIPNFGLSIILLTLLVRSIMFPLSRKQAMMTLKMQALQPELKALQEKHKDDRQAYATEQMRIFRENGVNPFGSCWVILLQMPIFMGLYFSLQESITFRLAPFWPTWITNLAAPDMMLEWGRNIPLLSRDSDYGGFLYLGPYFNLLPIFAVAFMVVQQKMMTPPATNKEQEMQQKMMRYMMLFFGLFFYKMAAGLCIYIITSTVWGFAERQLLPKVKKPVEGSAPPSTEASAIAAGTHSASTAITNGGASATAVRKPGKNRRKGGRPGKDEPAVPATGLEKIRQRLSDWWSDVLEQAKKK